MDYKNGKQKQLDCFANCLINVSDCKYLQLHNKYCESNNCTEEEIYNLDDVIEDLAQFQGIEAIRRVHISFDECNEYFKFVNGEWQSSNEIDSFIAFSYDVLAKYIFEHELAEEIFSQDQIDDIEDTFRTYILETGFENNIEKEKLQDYIGENIYQEYLWQDWEILAEEIFTNV